MIYTDMADLIRQVATASNQIIEVFLHTSTFTGITNLTTASAGTCYYKRNTATGSTLITLTGASLGTWTSGGFAQVDSIHMPGLYEISVPNAALVSGADNVSIMLQGASTAVPTIYTIDLNAEVNTTKWAGQIIPTPLTTGVPLVQLGGYAHGGASASLELGTDAGGGNGAFYCHNANGHGVQFASTNPDDVAFVGLYLQGGNGGAGLISIGGTGATGDIECGGLGYIASDLQGNVLGAGASAGPSGLPFGGVGVQSQLGAGVVHGDQGDNNTTLVLASDNSPALVLTGNPAAELNCFSNTVNLNLADEKGSIVATNGIATLAIIGDNATGNAITLTRDITISADAHDIALAGSGELFGDIQGNIIGAGASAGPSGLPFGGVGVQADVEQWNGYAVATGGNGVPAVNLTATGLNAIPTTDPRGVATTLPQMIVQLWRRFFKSVSKDATTITTYQDDGITPETTQPYTQSGSNEQVNNAS